MNRHHHVVALEIEPLGGVVGGVARRDVVHHIGDVLDAAGTAGHRYDWISCEIETDGSRGVGRIGPCCLCEVAIEIGQHGRAVSEIRQNNSGLAKGLWNVPSEWQ